MWTVWISPGRYCTLPGIRRRMSSRWRPRTICTCSKSRPVRRPWVRTRQLDDSGCNRNKETFRRPRCWILRVTKDAPIVHLRLNLVTWLKTMFSSLFSIVHLQRRPRRPLFYVLLLFFKCFPFYFPLFAHTPTRPLSPTESSSPFYIFKSVLKEKPFFMFLLLLTSFPFPLCLFVRFSSNFILFICSSLSLSIFLFPIIVDPFVYFYVDASLKTPSPRLHHPHKKNFLFLLFSLVCTTSFLKVYACVCLFTSNSMFFSTSSFQQQKNWTDSETNYLIKERSQTDRKSHLLPSDYCPCAVVISIHKHTRPLPLSSCPKCVCAHCVPSQPSFLFRQLPRLLLLPSPKRIKHERTKSNILSNSLLSKSNRIDREQSKKKTLKRILSFNDFSSQNSRRSIKEQSFRVDSSLPGDSD